MATDRFLVEPLGPHHERAAFSCGVDALDRYFHRQASQDQRRRVAGVFVLQDAAHGSVVGYYTLSSASIAAADLPTDATKELPRYPNLPAILLGRLAVDLRYRGQGFGRRLLIDALRRALAQTRAVGAVAVLVDAKDDAARWFYEGFGFEPVLDDERRLYLLMSTIAKL